MFSKITKLYFSLFLTLMVNVSYSQCEMPNNSLSINGSDIWYNSTEIIGGFQFSVDGALPTGASGGDAASAGFTVSTGGSTVLGFSFTGGTIPAGCGTLTSLSLDGTASGLSNIVMSDPSGNSLNFSYFDSSGGGDIVCEDENACNFGEVGECTFSDYLSCDCDGNVYDGYCDCDGSVLDDCGDCGGDGADVMCDDGSMACSESDCSSDSEEIESGCDLPENNLYLLNGDVLYNSSSDIGGFQFSLDGGSLNGAAGGDAAAAGFTVSTGGSTVLGVSFTGGTISAGCGTLTSLSFDGNASGLSGIVMSDPSGNSIEFDYYDGSSEPELGTATVQIIHNSASPTVDVYVDGGLAISGFEYRTATGLLELPTSFTVGIAPTGGEVIADFPFELVEGGSYVVVATGLLGDTTTPFGLAAAATEFNQADATTVGLNVYHGSTDAPAVDIWADDAPLLTSFSYGDFSGPVEVPAADYTLGVAPAGGDIIAAFTAPLSGLGGGTAVVFASGFLSGDDPAFGLFAALTDGTVLTLPSLDQDCAGEWGGDAVVDECGECNGSGPNVSCDDGSMVCEESECVDVSDSYFNLEIAETGESTLFIFQDSITSLDSGDQIGIYDMAGIVDSTGATGMILVGAGTWTGSQLEITAISSVDLSEFGGPILPGSVSGNNMSFMVYDVSDMMLYDASFTTSSGSGTFNGLFTAINSITLVEPNPPYFSVEIDETGESTLFIFEDTIQGLEVGDNLGLFDMMGVLDSQGNTGEVLVGSGIWNGSQLNITAITSVDLSEFGGPILPGAVEGNSMSLRVWKVSDESVTDVTYGINSGSGTFNGLFTAINSVSFTPPCADDDDAVAPFGCAAAVATFGCDFAWGTDGFLISDFCPETCGTCPAYGCTDESACNYDSEATDDDGSCTYPDEMLGECDCDGTLFDECGVCGGNGPSYQCVLADGSVELVCDEQACDILDSSVSPESYSLSQNYPNPFNPVTTINFDVANGGSFVEIKVYDILGNFVKTLISDFYSSGSYGVKWNGTNNSNVEVPSGVYIYQLTHDSGMITKKMILLR